MRCIGLPELFFVEQIDAEDSVTRGEGRPLRAQSHFHLNRLGVRISRERFNEPARHCAGGKTMRADGTHPICELPSDLSLNRFFPKYKRGDGNHYDQQRRCREKTVERKRGSQTLGVVSAPFISGLTAVLAP